MDTLFPGRDRRSRRTLHLAPWKSLRGLIWLAPALAVFGCASEPTTETTAALTRAHALVSQAEQSGAQQYDPMDLQQARDKIESAEQLQSAKTTQALRLANEAALDAQLASARAGNAKAQQDVQVLNDSLDSLSRAERHTEPEALSTAPPPPAQPQPPPPPSGPAPTPNEPPNPPQ
jgi:hypothetical protein